MTQSMKNVQIANVNSKLVLDISDDGTTVTQRKPDPNKRSQRWNIIEHDHLYLLENVQNGKVLAPDGEWAEGFRPKDGAGQQWRLTSKEGSVYYIENPYSGQGHVLEVDGSATNEGATVAQYSKHGGANQQWELIATTSTLTPGLPKYIQAGGSGWAWGYGAYGQLGNGGTGEQTMPVEVVFPHSVTAKAVAVAAGYLHSLAALDDGSVWAWGENNNGRLGIGPMSADVNQTTPQEVAFPRDVTAKAIAVAAGHYHSLAALDDGIVRSWGYGAYGQLGNGGTGDQWTPVEVLFPRRVTAKAVAVAAGYLHSLAALDDGSVWAWGENDNGRLGIGPMSANVNQTTPQEVAFPRDVTAKAIAVAAGYFHSLAALDDGSVRSWGHGAYGQLGNGGTGDQWTPVEVLFPRHVTAKATAISAGAYHSLAALDDGSVWAWGENNNGRLGIGPMSADVNQTTPQEVVFPRHVTAKAIAVAAGELHSLALLDDGSVWAWGYGGNGRLGNGKTDEQWAPVEAGSLGTRNGAEAIAIAAGWAHSLACDGVLRH